MNTLFFLHLQIFAVQTTELKDSGNDLSPEMKTFYEKVLLKNLKPNLVHDQFGQKKDIPKNGGKTIEFRRFSKLAKALTPLTEGVTPAGSSLDVQTITATVSQYGDFVTFSDLLELTAVDNVIVEALSLENDQAGETLDTVVRNVLVGGTQVIYAPKSAGTAVTSRATLDNTCLFTPDLAFQAARQLKRKNAPKINGSYIGIIHPDVSYDIMRNAEWIDVHKYAAPDNIYEGEIGKLGSVRFVETTEAKIWTGDGCPSGLAVYGCIFLGADAYGSTSLSGGGLEVIVKQKGSAGTADPLNQRSSVGWKATKAAERLSEERIVRVECCSSMSAIAEAN